MVSVFSKLKSLFLTLKILSRSSNPKVRGSEAFRALSSRFNYEPIEQVLHQAVDYARTIRSKGDYLEFGLWKGRSFVAAYHLAKSIDLNMKFYGFDSFEGLPELSAEDQMHEEYKKGEYSCSIEEFRSIMLENDVSKDDVTLTEGFYEDSLNEEARTKLPLKEAAIIMIDCDLYDSTKLALDFSTPYIRSGTVIIFEDWFCYRNDPNFGEQKAFNEWLVSNPEFHASDFAVQPTLKAFVIFKSN